MNDLSSIGPLERGTDDGAPGPRLSRRALLKNGAAACLAGAAGACVPVERDSSQSEGEIELSTLSQCEKILDLDYTADERAQILATIDNQLDAIRAVHAFDFENTLAPALVFDPRLPGRTYAEQSGGVRGTADGYFKSPADQADLVFAPATVQAHWIRTKKVSSRELTQAYLDRITRYNPLLFNYITVTGELALEQADRADQETAAGVNRGPLHGIPYGVKDLIDTADIRTTWGATPYRNRVAKRNAWVIDKLEQAGAVLLGKTTSGALAYTDQWFGGRTRNPWNPNEGSTGSSAGSASATAAGMCGFSIGTETVGSIVGPSSRCGAAGLRPTFGRVPRTGTMALCWSLDKIGAICRSVADIALVLEAINGQDPGDPSSLGHGFEWDAQGIVDGMRVGYMPSWFDDAGAPDKAALEAVRAMPVDLVELALPDWPYSTLFNLVEIEAAAAFHELTSSNRDDEMVWQADRAWPNTFRRAHLYSAVDFVQVDRFRRKIMSMMDEMMTGVDAIISPSYSNPLFSDPLLLITTFTGHPCLTLRAGFVEIATRIVDDIVGDTPDSALYKVPKNVMLWGPLFEERKLLTLGLALEKAMNVGQIRPGMGT